MANDQGQNPIKWIALLDSLRHEHAANSDALPLLLNNRIAEDIVMGWVGVQLFKTPPGIVLEDSDIETSEKIAWLWSWVNMPKAVQYATRSSCESSTAVTDALGWLINNGIIWPDGSVSQWVGIWRRAKAQSKMAGKLKIINQSEKLQADLKIAKMTIERMEAEQQKKQSNQGTP